MAKSTVKGYSHKLIRVHGVLMVEIWTSARKERDRYRVGVRPYEPWPGWVPPKSIQPAGGPFTAFVPSPVRRPVCYCGGC